ncbi:MAG: helicase, partial [Clostridia bacterium]|nr:helicase [Clostridia bacterium]
MGSSKFFTNEPEKNLYDRFTKLLDKNTQFFDVLVGYFRASGFYLLKDSLSKVEKTRILIGLNADRKTVEMLEEAEGEVTNLSNFETIDNYKKNLQNEFEKSDDSEEVEKGVKQFIDLINAGKLEIRVYTKQPIHAKIYIMRDFPGQADKGRVITGSSNFSQNGLKNNLEFNVELRDDDDLEYALKKFEELWEESVEVNRECVDTIENKTWIKSDITPYEMYLKFLYEYFKEEINDDKLELGNNAKYYPEGFKPLQYQKDAVIQAKRMLEKHNGIFLSDVVGLGKTYICALLAQELNGGILVLCPPVLKEYWENVLFDFGVRRFTVESEGKLDKIIDEGTDRYDYVFVDESHRFRNAETEQYQKLHQICYGKKVVLISATPQNNYISDIASQLYLFESKNRSSIVGTRNLELFFASLKTAVNSYEKGTDGYKRQVTLASQKVRDEVLREVMIRRTRSEIKKVYGKDLEEQGLKFPEVADPQKLTYEFDDDTEKVFEKTVQDIEKLNYSRYKPLTYIIENELSSEQRQLIIGQENMGGFMKGVLVKRLESSKYAFEQTLNRFIKSYNEFIDMYNNGTVWISQKLKVQELLDTNNVDKLLEAVDRQEAMKFDSKDFRSDFIRDLNADLHILNELKELWSALKKDDKLEYFIKRLKEESNLNKGKLIIFTESSETAMYLQRELENKLGEKVLQFNGSMSDSIRDEIKANFDYNYQKEKQKDEYRLLVTTDVLAEGMNLHRSNVIIDYDLPWNPTRIMQRVGRINRVGTPFEKIFVYNFFPTSKSNAQMSLEENIKTKIQMFYTILGSDAKYLTEDEEVGAFELFKRVNSSIKEEEINDLDMELL